VGHDAARRLKAVDEVRRLPRRVRRTRTGDFQIRLPQSERDILRSLPDQLRELLDTNDVALERLFPPAYPDDPESEAEYRGLVREDLRAGRLSSLQIMESTIDSERLDEEQLTAWLGAINDLRLVLGSRLGVTEELYEREIPDEDPNVAAYALYFYLGWLQEQVVEALASGLDPSGSPET
jgi:Domain of unknown function (DUF2017)